MTENIFTKVDKGEVIHKFSKSIGKSLFYGVFSFVGFMVLLEEFPSENASFWGNSLLFILLAILGFFTLIFLAVVISPKKLIITKKGIDCEQFEENLIYWNQIDYFEDLINVERFSEDKVGVIIHFKTPENIENQELKLSKKIYIYAYDGTQEEIMSALKHCLKLYKSGKFQN